MANPNLQMFRSDIPTEEIGIESNPLNFGFCPAGVNTLLPYDIILWNDKGEVLGSEDAKEIYVELLRMTVYESHISSGGSSQTFTVPYIPVVNDDDLIEITVDGIKWARVGSLIGQNQNEVYTFDCVTGILLFGDNINGKIPPIGLTIGISYTPDKNIFSKTVYSDQWISIRSLGIVENELTVPIELSTKIDDDTIEVIHFPYLSDVVGVWDNVGKTGTNYYTGGSFDSNTGRITLGTSLTTPNPYVEYKYKIKDDNESSFTALGDEEQLGPLYRIPKNNAKKIQLMVSVPSTASSEGGAYIQAYLRFYYNF